MDGEKMEKLNLVGIVGTNAEKSTNRTLLKFMQKHFATQAELTLIEVKDLPFFDKLASHEAPAAVAAINQAVAQADGVIIATPEYDHTIPAPLTNLLEWFAYTAKPLQDKPVMIVGASYGVLGTSRAQNHLRQILNAPELRALVLPGREFLLGHSLQAFDEEANLLVDEKVAQLESYFADFAAFVTRVKA